jgi:predicted esterase
MSIWAPDAEGVRPVVYLLHGIGGSRSDMEPLGRTVAEQGYVVFALDWDENRDPYRDVACGYHYGQSIAAEHGGDANRPVAVGYSQGATYALLGATSPEMGAHVDTFDPCSVERGKIVAPIGQVLPNVLVLIAPCLFEYQGKSVTPDLAGGNTDLRITVVSGENDTVCEPWQQEEAVTFLQKAGYDTRLVSVPSADHHALVYQEMADDRPVPRPDSPAGRRTTRAILDAIEAAGW